MRNTQNKAWHLAGVEMPVLSDGVCALAVPWLCGGHCSWLETQQGTRIRLSSRTQSSPKASGPWDVTQEDEDARAGKK
jgi:hypothetical protein